MIVVNHFHFECGGSGRVSCKVCQQRGHVQCKTCHGKGLLKHWMQVHIKYKVDVSNFITIREGLKLSCLSEATGIIKNQKKTIASVEKVAPIAFEFDEDILRTAKSLVSAELAKKGNSRQILKVYQEVKLIPVVRVNYKNKKSSRLGHFFIYGREKRVYYPAGSRYLFSNSKCSIM